MIERLALQAGGVAVFDPGFWFASMPLKAAVRWAKFYAIEPWGNRESGLRTGMLAFATGEVDRERMSVEDFIVSGLTREEAANKEKWEREAAAFRSWWHKKGG